MNKTIVCGIIGHVNHGKTTLLDAILNTEIQKKEVNGITQEINSYIKTYEGTKIIFIDTPGHASLKNMQKTIMVPSNNGTIYDCIVVVIDINKGIEKDIEEILIDTKKQMKDQIEHGENVTSPFIFYFSNVADEEKQIGKIETIKGILASKYDFPIIDEYNSEGSFAIFGDSIKKNKINDLLDIISNVERKEYNSDFCYLINPKLNKKGFITSTVIVRNGQLEIGDYIVASNYAKIKKLPDNKPISVESNNLQTIEFSFEQENSDNDISTSEFTILKDASNIKQVQDAYKDYIAREAKGRVLLNNIVKPSNPKYITKVFLRANNSDMLVSIANIINELNSNWREGYKYIDVVNKKVGAITINDVSDEKMVNEIITFNIFGNNEIAKRANQSKIKISENETIADIEDNLKKIQVGDEENIMRDAYFGEAEVKKTYKKHPAIGCICTSGEIKKGDLARVIRKGEKVELFNNGDFYISSMKYQANKNVPPADIDSAQEGDEFGIIIKGGEDKIQVGDIIQTYKKIKSSDIEKEGYVKASDEELKIAIIGYGNNETQLYETTLKQFFPNAKINVSILQDDKKLDVKKYHGYDIVFVGAMAHLAKNAECDNAIIDLEKNNKRVVRIQTNGSLDKLSPGKIKRKIIS